MPSVRADLPSSTVYYTHTDYKVPNKTTEPDGTVFLSGLQHLAIKYCPLSYYRPAASCGHVIREDMPVLRDAGQAI